MSGEDPARFLAGTARRLYPLSPQATAEEVERLCDERGYLVLRAPLAGRGYCLFLPDEAIILRADAGAFALCHEILHLWLWENSCNGISYDPPEWEAGDEEAAADRFAACLSTEGQFAAYVDDEK
jgi:Zn-dependent peptidase ImmA (M78 family)